MHVTPTSFGAFLAPFHFPEQDPTLALERDLLTVECLDRLGYDEAWIGEHHSAGWGLISCPEVFIAAAAQRTRRIRLATGVVALPYHHPFLVAERMVLLDHLLRGRVLFGVGAGALPSDGHMLGLQADRTRPMMEEALKAILALLRSPEPVSQETGWFSLRDARLQLRPYSRPHPPIAVASNFSTYGMEVAGRLGLLPMSLVAFVPPEWDHLRRQWEAFEAASAGAADRADWRLALPVHVAERRDAALARVRAGMERWLTEYFEGTLGWPVRLAMEGRSGDLVEAMVGCDAAIVGTPHDCIEAIERLVSRSGGFGGLVAVLGDWASPEDSVRSLELFARFVTPHFRGSAASLVGSQRWVAGRRGDWG